MKKAERRATIRDKLLQVLNEERQRQGLSLNQLASRCGLNQSTMSRLQGEGESNPTLDSLLRIAEEMDLNLGKILDRVIRVVDSASPRPPRPQ